MENILEQLQKSGSNIDKPVEKPCVKCLPILGKDLPHQCTPGTRRENLGMMAESDPFGAEQVALSVVLGKDSSLMEPFALVKQKENIYH